MATVFCKMPCICEQQKKKKCYRKKPKNKYVIGFLPEQNIKEALGGRGGEVEGRACDFFLKVSPSVTRRPFSSMGFIKVHRARSGEKGKQKSEQNITEVK